jgi:His-Xaa-Ser system radical SAM maturase HxsC
LKLQTYGATLSRFSGVAIGRITSEPREPRRDHVLKVDRIGRISDLAGYAGLLTLESLVAERQRELENAGVPTVFGVKGFDHLEDGDVVALHPGGYVRTLYRIGSRHNALFATDRCNSFCLMCSQPPRPVDDRDRAQEHLRLIELIDPSTTELGITGGEPTLLKSDLLRIVERCKELLPGTSLHILSNGRLFYYGSFAEGLGLIEHPDLMIGVPLYSDLDFEHDFIVQAAGAFDETMIGLQNLERYGVPVEIRVVIHRLTYRRLLDLAEFIYRNLSFAAHVVLMGLEMMGFAVPHRKELWIDPFDYREELREATWFLAARGMNVSIYNHQLCVMPRDLWHFCRQSISDWKNEYLPACDHCLVRERCGGFFASALQHGFSRHIAPISAA